jgi:hypothetical protein
MKAHRDAVALFEASKAGDNAELKDWAGKTLPHLKEHLSSARTWGSAPAHADTRAAVWAEAQISAQRARFRVVSGRNKRRRKPLLRNIGMQELFGWDIR